MDYFDLVCIKRVADLGSISRAAEELFIAQPNLSRKIKAIEKEINTKIFLRSNAGVELTEKGREFILATETLVDHWQDFENKFTRKDNVAELSIISARSSYVCSAIINYINNELDAGNRIEVKFQEAINSEVISGVFYKAFDVGIVRPTSINANTYYEQIKSYNFNCIQLPCVSYVILMHESHPLAKYDSIPYEKLADYTEVVYFDFENAIVSFRELAGRKLTTRPGIIRVCDRGSLLDTVSQVYGAFMVTTGTNPENLKKNNLVEIPCSILNFYSCDMVIYKDSQLKDIAVNRFIDFLKMAFPS